MIEGVHLTPDFMWRMMKKYPGVIAFSIIISKEEKHMERFAIRSKHMTLDPKFNKYVKYLKNIRAIQRHNITKSEAHLIPLVDNNNIDKSLGLIHRTIMRCLKISKKKGEMKLCHETNKTALYLYENFNKITKNVWSSQPVLEFIKKGVPDKMFLFKKMKEAEECQVTGWPSVSHSSVRSGHNSSTVSNFVGINSLASGQNLPGQFDSMKAGGIQIGLEHIEKFNRSPAHPNETQAQTQPNSTTKEFSNQLGTPSAKEDKPQPNPKDTSVFGQFLNQREFLQSRSHLTKFAFDFAQETNKLMRSPDRSLNRHQSSVEGESLKMGEEDPAMINEKQQKNQLEAAGIEVGWLRENEEKATEKKAKSREFFDTRAPKGKEDSGEDDDEEVNDEEGDDDDDRENQETLDIKMPRTANEENKEILESSEIPELGSKRKNEKGKEGHQRDSKLRGLGKFREESLEKDGNQGKSKGVLVRGRNKRIQDPSFQKSNSIEKHLKVEKKNEKPKRKKKEGQENIMSLLEKKPIENETKGFGRQKGAESSTGVRLSSHNYGTTSGKNESIKPWTSEEKGLSSEENTEPLLKPKILSKSDLLLPEQLPHLNENPALVPSDLTPKHVDQGATYLKKGTDLNSFSFENMAGKFPTPVKAKPVFIEEPEEKPSETLQGSNLDEAETQEEKEKGSPDQLVKETEESKEKAVSPSQNQAEECKKEEAVKEEEPLELNKTRKISLNNFPDFLKENIQLNLSLKTSRKTIKEIQMMIYKHNRSLAHGDKPYSIVKTTQRYIIIPKKMRGSKLAKDEVKGILAPSEQTLPNINNTGTNPKEGQTRVSGLNGKSAGQNQRIRPRGRIGAMAADKDSSKMDSGSSGEEEKSLGSSNDGGSLTIKSSLDNMLNARTHVPISERNEIDSDIPEESEGEACDVEIDMEENSISEDNQGSLEVPTQ